MASPPSFLLCCCSSGSLGLAVHTRLILNRLILCLRFPRPRIRGMSHHSQLVTIFFTDSLKPAFYWVTSDASNRLESRQLAMRVSVGEQQLCLLRS